MADNAYSLKKVGVGDEGLREGLNLSWEDVGLEVDDSCEGGMLLEVIRKMDKLSPK